MNAATTAQQTTAPIGKGLAAAKKATKKPSPAKVTKGAANHMDAATAKAVGAQGKPAKALKALVTTVTKPTAERDTVRATRYPSAAKRVASKAPGKAQRADENTYETPDAALKAALAAQRERAGIFQVKPGVFAVASRKTGIRAGWEFLGRAVALQGLPTATQGNKSQTAKKPAKAAEKTPG